MHISVEPRDDHAILHLRGEFDTYYVPHLQKEIDDLVKAGITRVVLNLRLVKFINSTALGAIIKASKGLAAKQGKLAISRPSARQASKVLTGASGSPARSAHRGCRGCRSG